MTKRDVAGGPQGVGLNRIEKIIEFSGFRDLAPPNRVAETIVEVYGAGAADAARECVASAFGDQRYDDYCFWLAVLGLVDGTARAKDDLEADLPVWRLNDNRED